MISLALAIGAAAVVSASEAELRSARADFERNAIVSALEGGQQTAAVTLLESSSRGVLRWTEQAAGHRLEVLAEPETAKASVASVISMDDKTLAPLRLADPQGVRARLKMLSIGQAVGAEFDQVDSSSVWRACARSLISPFGLGDRLKPLPEGSLAPDAPTGHAGEIWRVRVRDDSGWTDDRVIRLTGDNLRPAATLSRRFSKTVQEHVKCASYFDSIS